MQQLSSYALAVSEGNAAGRLAVTAPTLGSAGTIPSIVYVMKRHLKCPGLDADGSPGGRAGGVPV